MFTSSASDRACIFFITWPRWILTVISLSCSQAGDLLVHQARR